MMCKHLRLIAIVCLALLTGLPGQAGTRKGDKFFKQARAAELKKDWDAALQFYKQAVDEDPRDSGYLIGMQRSRFQASSMHVDRGQKIRAEGNIQDAIAEFQKAIIADPSSAIALQDLRRAIGSADQVLRNADSSLFSRDAPASQDLRDTLQEVAQAARSVRMLLDYLERHPEMLIRGKSLEKP